MLSKIIQNTTNYIFKYFTELKTRVTFSKKWFLGVEGNARIINISKVL